MSWISEPDSVICGKKRKILTKAAHYRRFADFSVYIHKETCKLIRTADEKRVGTIPGAMQLTRIFSGPRDCAAAFINPIRAVLLTEYAPKSCNISYT